MNKAFTLALASLLVLQGGARVQFTPKPDDIDFLTNGPSVAFTSNPHELNLPIAATDLFKLHASLSEETRKVPRVTAGFWDKTLNDVAYRDWGIFFGGMTLGILITLLTSGLGALISPCLAQWATAVLLGYTFYIYMLVFEDNGMESLEEAFVLSLTMAQFV